MGCPAGKAALAPDPSSLLLHCPHWPARWLKSLHSCHPHGRPRLRSGPDPAREGIWGGKSGRKVCTTHINCKNQSPLIRLCSSVKNTWRVLTQHQVLCWKHEAHRKTYSTIPTPAGAAMRITQFYPSILTLTSKSEFKLRDERQAHNPLQE